MIKYLYKKVLLVFLSIIVLTSCSKLEHPYDKNTLISNLSIVNEDMFADGTAKNIVVPSSTVNQIVDSVGASNYFVASTNRFKTNFTKFLNPYQKVPIASLTKLMTALVVFKNCKNLDEEYYVIEEDTDFEPDASSAKLRSGDKLKVIDLLYGLLVPSGNDAAMCLANNLDGGYDNFVIMMNNEAERIGAFNTHFANPHGLDSEYHFSTAYDLFLITRELMKYPEFKKISTTREYIANITSSDGTIRTEKWLNTDYFVTGELLLNANVELIAGKTGNTKKLFNANN